MSSAPNESGLNPELTQRVSAILVAHNGARWLPEVVAALSSQLRSPDVLLAVDTGSTDGSRELLHNSRIEVLSAPVDTGFGAAVALAVASLPPIAHLLTDSGEEIAHESEWLWLIHDDCAPAPDALAELLAAVAQRPNVGVVGPKILGWHDRNHLLEIGITLAHNGARWTGLERNERDQGQHDGDGAIPVLAVSTAGALIRRDLFDEIGGFDSNLPLFRDDVDFGMRARMAGYSVMCVTSAKLFHAEAAATERRTIDVNGGAFHRPHLLDRQHAAFVLLANLPLWTLPWIALRIFATSLVRAAGYLLAKLPGYALDELGAVALLFTRVDRLRIARSNRRKQRLLPARVIRSFLAPWSEQVKLGALRLRDLIFRRVERTPETVVGNISLSSSNSLTDLEDGELLAPVNSHFWRERITRPLSLATLILLTFCFISGRTRFGQLAGGSLPISGDSSWALLQSYGQSWHALGVGSANASHPFGALLALAALTTGANPTLFVTGVMMFAPVLALWSMYLLLRKSGIGQWVCAGMGLLYGTSTVMLTSVNVGLLTTVILTPLAPLALLSIKATITSRLTTMSWRRTCAYALLLVVLSTLSFQIFLLALIAMSIHLWSLRGKRSIRKNFTLQYLVIAFSTFFALAPWSLEHIIVPKNLFLDQGIPIDFGSPWRVLTGNLQPAGTPTAYLIGISFLIALIALFSQRVFSYSLAIFGILALTAFASVNLATSFGNSLPSKIWPGGLLVTALCLAMFTLAQLCAGLRTKLQNSSLGKAHFVTVIVAAIALYSVATNLFWWVSDSQNAPVQKSTSSVLPAFIETATTNPDRPKTLILRSNSYQGIQNFIYVILRDRDVRMGELSSLPLEVPILTQTVSEIASGVGNAPAATLAKFGIRYLYLENGRENGLLARKIDGIGGLTRLSATTDGILWQISGLTSRITFFPKISTVESDGKNESESLGLPSEVVGAEFDVPSAGTVHLAEIFDSRWRILHGGRVLLPKRSDLGLTQFEIPDLGRVVLFHEGTIHRAGISLQVAVLGLLLFFALPRGRRQRELSDEEVS